MNQQSLIQSIPLGGQGNVVTPTDSYVMTWRDSSGNYWGRRSDGVDEPIGNSNGFGGGLLTFSFSRTAVEIQNGFSVPYDILPEPGIGKAIEVQTISAEYTNNGIAFTTAVGFFIIETLSVQQLQTSAAFFTSLANKFSRLTPINVSDIQLAENKKLQFITDADSAVGNGTIKVYGSYRIITLLP